MEVSAFSECFLLMCSTCDLKCYSKLTMDITKLVQNINTMFSKGKERQKLLISLDKVLGRLARATGLQLWKLELMSIYRPVSLLNTDHTILVKILSIRLGKKVLESIIHQDQTCAVPPHSIIDILYSFIGFIFNQVDNNA